MTNLDHKSQKFKLEKDSVKRKHLEGTYLVYVLRSVYFNGFASLV